MRKNKTTFIVVQSVVLTIVLGGAYRAKAQNAATAYPNMVPIEHYLMDRTAEIALARSAAPESISRDADVLVLGRNGFETAVKGRNGFVCIVGRSWTSAADADFSDPKVRSESAGLSRHRDGPSEHLTQFVMQTQRWSDGTEDR